MFKVHIGHTPRGNDRWKRFETMEGAQAFCSKVFSRAGVVLAIVADTPRRSPVKPDLTYSCSDGIWTRFMPESPAGVDAWNTMAEAMPGGAVAFLPWQVPDVLAQLRKAGLVARKAKPHKPASDAELSAMLAELTA